MKRVPTNDPDDDFEVEITSLDTPETPEHAHDEFLQGARLAPRVRISLTILCVVGGILLIFVVLSPILSSLLPKKTSTPPVLHLPPAQIEDVTVQNGIAYITSSDGTFRALRMQNGSLLWQRNLAGAGPFFTNDTIYINNYSKQTSIIQALRAKDGAVLWTFKSSLDISPLVIDHGVAYTLFQGPPQGHILTALDSRNGAELWHYAMNIARSQSADIQEMQDKIYITVSANYQAGNIELFVLKMSDGLPLWHTTAAAIQVIQNNLVGVTTNNGVLNVLRADNGHEIWHFKSPSGASLFLNGNNLFYMQTTTEVLQALRADNGAVLWAHKDPWGVAEIFPEANGVLYVETGDGFLEALRTSDGTQLWRVRPIPPPFTFGSTLVDDGIVYTFTTIGGAQDETIAALRTSSGSILWRRKVDVSSSINMPPQILNGQLLVNSGSTITVLSARDGAVLWHANNVQSTLQYNNDIMLLHSSDSALEAHQLETGTLLWRYPRASS